ncbi:tetratricopeptide repeat protein [Candidatus Uabimicrobium amorphum]|uniref:Beta-barrel assembly-enhancing protease n=1 Tax=Uabimicrobium amorphum TaxID=2596890 RepID=A0A5S9IQ39_UABAM|nr:tetratricopeptide repeat protein [Candidatus Uabimicrobium amorphum]BBM85080.1 beta-barrel assembly-enhancing protease [Candidatus Uabimicrobium amorphum]
MKKKWKIAVILLCVAAITSTTIYYFRPHARKMRYYNTGIIYLQQNKYPQAISNFKNALAIDRDNFEFRYRLALAYVKDERWQQALNTIDVMTNDQQKSFDIYSLLIQVYIHQKKYNRALEYSGNCIKLFSHKAHSYILHAKVLQEMNYPHTEKYLEKAISVDPKYVDSYIILSAYFADKNLFDKATHCLKRYIQQNGHHIEIGLLLCNYLIEQKQYKKCISLLQELRDKFAKHHERLATPLSFSLLQIGEVEKAWQVLQQLSATSQYSEKNSRLIYTRGVCRVYKKMYAEGINDLLWFRREFPKISSTYYYLSIAYFETDKSAIAFREINRAVQLSPQNTAYQKFLINKLAQYEKWSDIEQKIQIFGKQALQDPQIQKLYAQALLQQQNYKKLEKMNNKASNFTLELAWSKFLQGQSNDAIAALKKHKNNNEAHYLLAKIYTAESNWFQALRHAQIFLQKKPQSKYGLWLVAQIREAQGLYSEAQKICRDLIEKYPNDAALKNYLTLLYLETDPQQAQQYYTQNFAGSVSFTQAQIHIANQDFSAAIATLKKIPNKNSQYLLTLGNAHLSLNQISYATDAYFKAQLQAPQTQAIEYFILAKILSHQQYTATTILERHPHQNEQITELLVVSYLLSGQPKKAQRYLKKLSPQKFPLLYSAYYFETKKYNKAKSAAKYIGDRLYRRDIQQCILDAQQNQFSFTPLLLLDKLTQKDLWRPALTKIQETFIVMGNHFVVKLKEAQILEHLGDEQQAMQIYQELESVSQTARWQKAMSHYKKQQFSAARNALQHLTQDAPPKIWLQLGNTYLQQKDYAKSLQYYRKAQQQPHQSISLELSNNIAWAMLHTTPPQAQKALKYAKKLQNFTNTSAAAADTLGWAYLQNGDRKKALYYLQRAKLLLPGNQQIEKHLNMVGENK